MEEQVKIKLSPEQINERKVNLSKTKMNIEMAELNIKHMERAIAENLPILAAQNELANMNKQLATLKHNEIALAEQIEKGEM